MSAIPCPLSSSGRGPVSSTGTVTLPLNTPAGWPTPRMLKAFRAAVWVMAGLLLLFGLSTLAQSRRAFQTIGKDTVPSIIAAEEIGYALADLDANVANSLLGNARHRDAASVAIEKQRLRVTDSLVDAAQNITYGDAEKRPIRAMTRDLGLYLERAAEARLHFSQGDEAAARATYWTATELLHTGLLSEAADLDTANNVQLEAAYYDGHRETQGAEVIAVILGGALVALLIALQAFLFRRFRRVVNVPLVGATVLTIVLTGYLAVRFASARESLRVAKEDAFDSIHSLVKARAIAYDANGDESRFLLDVPAAHGLEDTFRRKVASLTSQPLMPPPTQRALKGDKRAKAAGGPTGLFLDELRNVTFDGEYTSAARMVGAFRDYMTIDARIRKLAATARMPEAVELCIGDKPDESNAAFDRFDAALTSTLEINRAAFDHEMDETGRALATAEAVSLLLAIAIGALTWVGVRPRLREYST